MNKKIKEKEEEKGEEEAAAAEEEETHLHLERFCTKIQINTNYDVTQRRQ